MTTTTTTPLRTLFAILGAAATGAVAMYYLDPQLGRRRRALVRDKTVSAYHGAGDFTRTQTRRVGNRVKGLVHAVRPSGRPLDDDQLRERLQSKIGRAVSHPGAVHVDVDQGRVRLHGHVLTDELDTLLAVVSSLKGVASVDNQLEAHDEPGSVPALQGEPRRVRRFNGVLRPALPLLALTPVALALLGARRNTTELSTSRFQWRH
ncbi:MAG TPA: BON domain-containing protein [Lysobacter sp.]|nr:BON domain-containing protein [Lysobacter sp.]